MLGFHQTFAKPMREIVWASSDRDTFQIFTRNARNTLQRYVSEIEINEFNFVLLKSNIQAYVVHAPYVMNPASPDDDKRERAVRIITEDMEFLNKLAGKKYYVVHPGSHKGAGKIAGIRNLIDTLGQVDTHGIEVCVEWMAGGGTEIMSTPEEIEFFRVLTGKNITFDSAHVLQAGYEPIEMYERYKEMISVVHLNNSATVKGSHHDIHDSIQSGTMFPWYLKDLYNRVPSNTPIILETPIATMQEDYTYLKNVQ